MAEFPSISIFCTDAMEQTNYLTPAGVGAWFSLTLATWISPDCSLPDDDRKLMVRARCDAQTWAEVRQEVLAFWIKSDDGQLRHPGLTKAREFAIKNREAKRRGAAKTNETRWGGDGKDVVPPDADRPSERPAEPIGERPAEQVAEPIAQQSLSSSSPSSLSDSSEDKKADPAPPVPVVSGGKASKRKQPVSYTAEFEAFWKDVPKRKGDSKPNAMAAWQEMNAEQRIAASRSLPKYRTECEEKYRFWVHNYLSGARYDSYLPEQVASTAAPAPPRTPLPPPLGTLEREEYEAFATQTLSLTTRQKHTVSIMRGGELVELCSRLKADPDSADACRETINNYTRGQP